MTKPPLVIDPGLVRVTDHAVVRYLERVQGFPIDDIRRSLITPTVLVGMGHGATRVHCPEMGVTLQLAGQTIVTVLPLSRAGHSSLEIEPKRTDR